MCMCMYVYRVTGIECHAFELALDACLMFAAGSEGRTIVRQGFEVVLSRLDCDWAIRNLGLMVMAAA